jgi:hypothetical protein
LWRNTNDHTLPAHPYSGDETKNRAEAEAIQRELQEKYPETLYISPIANFKALEGMDYDTIMWYCLGLLEHCHGVTVTGRYRESKGCLIEIAYALRIGIPVFSYDGAQYKLLSSAEIAP